MFKTYIQEINNIRDLETVINYYYPNKLKRNKMSCPFHKDKTPSFSIVDKGNELSTNAFLVMKVET